MAKNNKLINSLRQIAARNRADNVETAAKKMTPEVYAAIALALYARGWRHKRISKLFKESGEVWEDYIENSSEKRMVQVCEELTGINLKTHDEATEEEIEEWQRV